MSTLRIEADARLICARKRTTSSLVAGILGKAFSDPQGHRERHRPDEEALKPWLFECCGDCHDLVPTEEGPWLARGLIDAYSTDLLPISIVAMT